MLDSMGVDISDDPSTTRIGSGLSSETVTGIAEVVSPPLKEIIKILNHESVNLYAEHLVKEMGKVFRNSGTTTAGIDVLSRFIKNSGISNSGLFLEDGSGLSPLDAITSRGLSELLIYMRNNAKYSDDFYSSLPEAGKEGTLKSYFRDPFFDNRMRAKSGSLTRVRSYAGYLTTASGKDLTFCIIINNFTGPSQRIIKGIEEILKEVILYK